MRLSIKDWSEAQRGMGLRMALLHYSPSCTIMRFRALIAFMLVELRLRLDLGMNQESCDENVICICFTIWHVRELHVGGRIFSNVLAISGSTGSTVTRSSARLPARGSFELCRYVGRRGMHAG